VLPVKLSCLPPDNCQDNCSFPVDTIELALEVFCSKDRFQFLSYFFKAIRDVHFFLGGKAKNWIGIFFSLTHDYSSSYLFHSGVTRVAFDRRP
jgi:hypothetical protein